MGGNYCRMFLVHSKIHSKKSVQTHWVYSAGFKIFFGTRPKHYNDKNILCINMLLIIRKQAPEKHSSI